MANPTPISPQLTLNHLSLFMDSRLYLKDSAKLGVGSDRQYNQSGDTNERRSSYTLPCANVSRNKLGLFKIKTWQAEKKLL